MNQIGERVRMGEGVKMWHFTYIDDDVEIGDGTSIGSLSSSIEEVNSCSSW